MYLSEAVEVVVRELLFELVSTLSSRRIEGDESAEVLCFWKMKAGGHQNTEDLEYISKMLRFIIMTSDFWQCRSVQVVSTNYS